MTALTAIALLLFPQVKGFPPQEKKPAPEAAPQPDPEKPQDPPPEEEMDDDPWPFNLQADLRIGGWRTSTFSATTPAGQRKIESTLLFDAGVDLRARLSGWTLALTADRASNRAMTLEMGGVLLGVDLELAPEPLPLDLQLAIGPIFGRLRVDEDFGSFRSAVGFEVRAAATSWVTPRIGISLWLDFRDIRFKYEATVTAGDTRAGGPTVAVGAGLVMRF